jgi:hypothetical protein
LRESGVLIYATLIFVMRAPDLAGVRRVDFGDVQAGAVGAGGKG